MAWENLAAKQYGNAIFWTPNITKNLGWDVFFDICVEVSSHGKKRWGWGKGILQSL